MKINIDSPFEAFSDHLSKPINERILFSGKFGYGKTYFLKHFFSSNDEYQSFWLSPVNYIVGQNEDIFEYIKIDIALQLLTTNDLKSDSTPEFTEDLYLHQYLRNKPYEVAALLSQTLKDLDVPILKQIAVTINNGLKAREEYEAWKKEWKENARSDFDKLIEFSLSHSSVKGSIFEDDIITLIIRLSLGAIKEKSKKNNVLIIDDFDRLDPEYIFRILNILSVHQNHITNENKFGFDKIIIVCSIDNIRKIYEYKYGLEVDFDGYIEKFYSTDIFHFNNQSAVASFCETNFSDDLDEDLLTVLGILLSFFVSQDCLTIRSIIKYEKVSEIRKFTLGPFPFSLKIDEIADDIVTHDPSGIQTINGIVWGHNYNNPIKNNVNDFYLSSEDFLILKIIQILTTVFGDYNTLKHYVTKLSPISSQFDSKSNAAVIRVFMPLSHVILNFDEPKNIFSNQISRSDSSYLTRPTALSIDLPQSQVLGPVIKINVGWNEENQYDGKTSYYYNVNSLFKNNSDISNLKLNDTNQLLHLLNIILDFFEKNGFLFNLGITR